MKRFIRTVGGKTILFMACILFVCLLVGCIACAYILLNNGDYKFYIQSEKEIYEEIINDQLRSRGYHYVLDAVKRRQSVVDDDGNLVFEVIDENYQAIYKSSSAIKVSTWAYSYKFDVAKNGDKVTGVYYNDVSGSSNEKLVRYTVNISLKEGIQESDEFAFIGKVVHFAYSIRYAVYFIGFGALLIAVACFIALMCVTARRPDSEELYPGPLNRIPFDVVLTLFMAAAAILIAFCDSATSYNRGLLSVLVVSSSLVLIFIMLLGLCISAAARIKQRNLMKNTVIYHCLRLSWRIACYLGRGIKGLYIFTITLIRSLPLIWKTAAIVFGLSFFELLFLVGLRREPGMLILLFLIEKLFLVPAFLYFTLCLRKLQKGGIALAQGDLSYITDTKGMFWDLKQHGENLNNIAVGMAIAVEERLKSERMKTELITNVSHDIKTPLTSIINYATLIGNETSENEKITEYSEVLVRQSERLKRLIDDLVEASKASTGNLDVNLAPCDASVFLTQASGEYEDKLKKTDLTLIIKQPEKELRIMADGRRMWRIFDNLMDNICKYAQSGTRVYLSLEEVRGNAVITFKNTSREPLDVSEEELMERFTRGDSSRNTEGNGLGLSIAKSLAELQNGSLRLSIDGDLFKAILSFPVI